MRRVFLLGLLVGCHRDLDVNPCSHDPASCEETGIETGAAETGSTADTEPDSTIEDSDSTDTAIAETSSDSTSEMVADTAVADSAVADTAIADTCTCVPGATAAGTGTCAAVLEKKVKTCSPGCTWGAETCALPKGWTAIALPPTGFEGRGQVASVWTGGELIVHGGSQTEGASSPKTDGAMYRLSTNTWSLLPTSGAPTPRGGHTAVWDGSRDMIVWGGRYGAGWRDDGYVFDTSFKTWETTPIAASPLAARSYHAGVWATTTMQMIIWGGQTAAGVAGDGAAFDPSTSTWTSLPSAPIAARMPAIVRWTGTEVLVWGGAGAAGTPLWDGALYNPTTKTWRLIPALPTTKSPIGAVGAYRGDRVVLFGGSTDSTATSFLMDGNVFSVSAGTWSPIAAVPSTTIDKRFLANAFIIGDRFHVWSGAADDGSGGANFPNDGAYYDFIAKSWGPMAGLDAPLGRISATVVSTPTFALFWSGSGKPSGGIIEWLRDGAIYVP